MSVSVIGFSWNHSPFRNVAFARGDSSQMGLHIVYILHFNAGLEDKPLAECHIQVNSATVDRFDYLRYATRQP